MSQQTGIKVNEDFKNFSSQIKEESNGPTGNDVRSLSVREDELQEISRKEVNTNIVIDTEHPILNGVANDAITDSAKQAVIDMAQGLYDYLQFRIDMVDEIIYLVCAENLPIERLPSKVPSDSGRYHLYKFKHTHEGYHTDSIVFIYSMPGCSCPIKERMLYSCFKKSLTTIITMLGLDIVKKLEIDSGDELQEKNLYEEIHPTLSSSK